MTSPGENEAKDIADNTEDHQLLMDGTVNPDYFDDDQVPRVRGLIELLEDFLYTRN